jgi:hypothetical protein
VEYLRWEYIEQRYNVTSYCQLEAIGAASGVIREYTVTVKHIEVIRMTVQTPDRNIVPGFCPYTE